MTTVAATGWLLRSLEPDDASELARHLRLVAAEGWIGLEPEAITAAGQRQSLISMDPTRAAAVGLFTGTRLIAVAVAVRGSGPLAHTATVAVSVEPAHRRHHAARTLLQELEHWAVHQRVYKLCASVLGDNRAARALFTRCGYQQEGWRRAQLALNGGWQDEVLFGKLLTPPAGGTLE